MSNLSELIPAGSGAKVAEFVASGTLASGQTVALKADGTVAAVSATGTPLTFGLTGSATTVLDTPTNNSEPHIAYDPVTNQIVIFYLDTNNNDYTTAVVGSVDADNTFTFGTPIVVQSASNTGFALGPLVWNTTENAVVSSWTTSSGLNVVAGTLETKTISLGTIQTYTSGTPREVGLGWNENDNAILVPFKMNNANAYIRKYTMSGSTLTYSAQSNTNLNMEAEMFIVGYDSSSQKCVLAYTDNTQFNWLSANVIDTSSGLTVGSKLSISDTLSLGTAAPGFIASDTDQNILAITWVTPDGSNGRAKAAVLTVSGTTLSVGSATQINSSSNWSFQSGGYSPASSSFVWTGINRNSPNQLFIQGFTVSGTTVTKTADTTTGPNNVSPFQNVALNTSNNAQFFQVWSDSSTRDVFVQVLNTSSSITNNTDFIGITNAAISNSATGEVVPQGGVITNSNLFPSATTASYGSAAVFESATTNYISAAFDSNSNRVVLAYMDGGNSNYGTAVVGTVSGTSISFGTPVVFEASYIDMLSGIAFDSNSNKVVIAYTSGGTAPSNRGLSIVGTVSGTSISFGSSVAFDNTAQAVGGGYISATFDSNSNKVVIFYTSSNYTTGSAIVGTVSGTSISYGSKATFESGATRFIVSTFDSTNNKLIVAYKDDGNSGYGTAVVGTVSGTSISFGSPVVFDSNGANYERDITYDSNANRAVIVWRGVSNYGYATVGTVSGTSISFGSAVAFTSEVTYPSVTFDSNLNKIFTTYRWTNSGLGKARAGSVSGTSISFDTESTFQNSAIASTPSVTFPVFDTSANKVVIPYVHTASSSHGTAIVATLTSGVPALSIGTDYFVQTDGTLSTTTSTVPAGRALSTTSILLEG